MHTHTATDPLTPTTVRNGDKTRLAALDMKFLQLYIKQNKMTYVTVNHGGRIIPACKFSWRSE